MTNAVKYPRIQEAKAQANKTIWVKFENGVAKVYDCKPLLRSDPFRLLEDDAIFRGAHADSNGYGVIWNDDIDLAESEIWMHGKDAEPKP